MRAAAVLLLSLSVVGCGSDRAIYADPGAEGNVASILDSLEDPESVDPSAGGADGSGGGGLVCPPLPPGRPLIPGLAAGWAAEGDELTVLQLGSHAFGCGTSITTAFEGAEACPHLWALELELPEVPLSVGELELSAEHPGVVVHFERSADGQGCARDEIYSSTQGFSGRLIIHEINDHCIVGELVDLGLPTNDLPDLSGVFVAERC